MLADTTNEPRTVEEGYASATGASHLRIEQHRSGAADIIAAAGMSPYRTGMALMRLRSEWDRAAKPKPPGPAEVDAAAKTLLIEPAARHALVPMTKEQIADVTAKLQMDGKEAAGIDWRALITIANPHAGLVRTEQGGKVTFRKPQRLAEVEAQRWHEHELGLLLQGLKSLPMVRAELERWIGGENAQRLVGDVLLWWLDPICKSCGGCGHRIVHGTGGRSSGKPCPECRYSATTGHRNIPFAGAGRRLVNHITSCYYTATGELRQALKKRRTPANVDSRDQFKKDAKIEQLRRADEVDKQDAKRDRVADSTRVSELLNEQQLHRGRK